jgi:PKD domain
MKILILCLSAMIALSGCEGGSDKKSSNPDPITPVESFSLGGAVSGLNGNLAIANGNDTITLNQDGPFVFAKKVNRGELYDIKIVALPQNQLCEIRNSRNYIYRNRGDIGIECANLVKRQVNIQIPNSYNLSDLRLMSNFEALGGSGEGILKESNEMTVFENSFLSLRNKDNNILYLSFIDSVEAISFDVNSMTTAKALVLLEPSVISAIHDRNITIAQIQHNLFITVDANGSLSKLSQQIQSHIEQGGSLLNVQNKLDQDLHDSVILALSALSKLPLSSTSNNSAQIIQKKNTVISPADDSGIKLTLEKTSASGQTLDLTANNSFYRHVTLHSSAFNSQTIGPDESITINLPTGLSSQASLPVIISGPGFKGNFSTEHLTKIVSASKPTSVYEFFIPSINILPGLKNPIQFTTKDCIDSEAFNLLINNISMDDADNQLLQNKHWHQLISSMTFDIRTHFIDAPLTSKMTPLESIFSCEKFGIGVLISTKKKYAIENTRDILKIVNSTHNNGYLKKSIDFFTIKTANKLSNTINNAYMEQVFTLSNQLKLNITLNPFIVEGKNINFTAACINPVDQTNVNCDVTWTFPSNTVKTGLLVEHIFVTDGNYSISVKAKDADGAEASQTLNIEVLDIAPRIEITNPNGISMQQNDVYQFNGVVIGETVPAVFSIKNSGFSDLTVNTISSTNNRFLISANLPLVVKPNETSLFTLAFTPTQKSNELSDINIQSNDVKNPSFILKASGSGLESLASWVVIKNGVEQKYTASRISTSYDQSLKRLQIRAFNSDNSDYPQIRILLNNYDLASNDRGNGEYSLDDIDQNETCLGFFATADDDTKIFCTQTLNLIDTQKKTGTAIVTSGSNPDNKRTTFTFDAIQRNCPAEICETIEVSGDIFYRDSF